MLDRPRLTYAVETQNYDIPRDGVELADIILFVKSYSRTLIAFPILALVCTGIYLLTSKPIYTAQTQILIEPKVPQLLQQPAAEVNLSLDTSFVESQLVVLRSQKIATMVIDELKLLEDPDFGSLRGPSVAERINLLIEKTRALLPWPGEQSSNGAARPQASAQRAGNAGAQASNDPHQRAVEELEDALSVQRVGVSYAVDIWYQSQSPVLAAKIANAIAEAFVREQLETRSANAREGVLWLERRIQEVRGQMNQATQAAQRFRAKHDYRVEEVRPLEPASGAPIEKPFVASNAPSLEELEVTAETYRKMYESLLQAYATTVNQQPALIANARVITAATQPVEASHPRSKITVAFGLLTGLMAGLVVAFLQHSLDRTVRTPSQVRNGTDIPFLGALPLVKFVRGGFGRLDETVVQPHGPVSDALTRLKAVLSESSEGKASRCIGVTAVSSGDGKTTLASNLAALYATSGKRTLVIDADTNAALTTEFHRSGLTVDLNGKSTTLEDKIWFIPSTGYYLLPLSVPKRSNSAEALSFDLLLAKLDTYQVIIVDLPSFGARTGRDLATRMDKVIVAAESGGTPLDQLVELGETLRSIGANLIGVVLMRCPVGSSRDRPLLPAPFPR